MMRANSDGASVKASLLKSIENGVADLEVSPKSAPRSESTRRRALRRRLAREVYDFLERSGRPSSKAYHAFVFCLILGSLVLSVLATVERYQNDPYLTKTVYYLEVALVFIFSLEYVLRLWSSSCHGTYKGFWGKFRFIRKPYMVIDIIVIIATIVVVITVTEDKKNDVLNISIFRFVRFLQVLRILRLDRQSGAFKIVSNVVYEHRQELLTCWYMSFIILIATSFLVYLAEKSEGNIPQMENLADGVYFGFITLLTIGYGDIAPKHWVSKLVVCVFSFVGVAFFALPSGILGSGFALQVAQQQRQKHFNRRRNPAALVVQYAWKCYAAHPTFIGQFTWVPHLYHLMEKKKLAQSNSTGQSVAGSPSLPRKRPFKKRAKNPPPCQVARRSSIGATIPSAVELRDRCMSEGNLVYGGNLLVGWKDNLDDNQATIVSLPPALMTESEEGYHYRLSIVGGKLFLPPRLLTPQEKNAIRFIRKVKLSVLIRKFKEVRRPYDVKDVIEQYSEGQLEMFGFIKKFQRRVEAALGIKEGEAAHISNINLRLQTVEKKVEAIDTKLDVVIRLLGGDDRPDIGRALHRSRDLLDVKDDRPHGAPSLKPQLRKIPSYQDLHVSQDYYKNALSAPIEAVPTLSFTRATPSPPLIDTPASLAQIFSPSALDINMDALRGPLLNAELEVSDDVTPVSTAKLSPSVENLLGLYSSGGQEHPSSDDFENAPEERSKSGTFSSLPESVDFDEKRFRSESRFTVTKLLDDSVEEGVKSKEEVEMQPVGRKQSSASMTSCDSQRL